MPATFLDAHGAYQLPTHWGEVTTKQYCDLDRLHCTTVEARASYFAGRPIQVNVVVADTLAFLLSAPPIPPMQAQSFEFSYPTDLGQETFLQVETIRALVAQKPLYECFCEAYGLFVTRMRAWKYREFRQDLAAISAANCADYPITDTYPAVAHCLAELRRLDETFAALSEPDNTEAGRKARQAGSDRLAVFSHLNVARAYAERFGTTIEAVYQWPWQQVALFLLQDKISAEVSDNLANQKPE